MSDIDNIKAVLNRGFDTSGEAGRGPTGYNNCATRLWSLISFGPDGRLYARQTPPVPATEDQYRLRTLMDQGLAHCGAESTRRQGEWQRTVGSQDAGTGGRDLDRRVIRRDLVSPGFDMDMGARVTAYGTPTWEPPVVDTTSQQEKVPGTEEEFPWAWVLAAAGGLALLFAVTRDKKKGSR